MRWVSVGSLVFLVSFDAPWLSFFVPLSDSLSLHRVCSHHHWVSPGQLGAPCVSLGYRTKGVPWGLSFGRALGARWVFGRPWSVLGRPWVPLGGPLGCTWACPLVSVGIPWALSLGQASVLGCSKVPLGGLCSLFQRFGHEKGHRCLKPI